MSDYDNPGELEIKLPNVETAQKQHYSVQVKASQQAFTDLKKKFKESPQDILSNTKASFNEPVDGEGEPTPFGVGAYIKIDIDAPFASGYVKVIALEEKEGSISATFATLEGHIEKGVIVFTLKDKGEGNFTFSINSVSEVDMGAAKVFKEKESREKQKESWEEVLDNVVKESNGNEVDRDVKIIDPKTDKKDK